MSKRQYLLSIIFISSFLTAQSQTEEDLKKVGLSDGQFLSIFDEQEIILTHHLTGKKKKIKEETLATIKIKGDTLKQDIVLEAILGESILISCYTPQLQGKEIRQVFTEYKHIPIDSIESIEYSVHRPKLLFWTGYTFTIIGVEFVILPIIMPLILNEMEETYSKPEFPITVAAGVILYILGRKMIKMTIPKEYRLGTEWNYEVVVNKI